MSLSPNRISSTATVSFSLMIGTSLASRSAASASRALLARVRIGEIGVGEEHSAPPRGRAWQTPLRRDASAHFDRRRRRLASTPSLWVRLGRPSFLMPSAMAPLDTIATLRPCSWARLTPVANRSYTPDSRQRARTDFDDDAPSLGDREASSPSVARSDMACGSNQVGFRLQEGLRRARRRMPLRVVVASARARPRWPARCRRRAGWASSQISVGSPPERRGPS